jgi:hypothetical protein
MVDTLSRLSYEVFPNGRYVGSLADHPQNSGAWGVLRLTRTSPNRITVQAVDEAGNGPYQGTRLSSGDPLLRNRASMTALSRRTESARTVA